VGRRLTALLQIAAQAAAYDIPVIPHGSGPYSYQFIASQPGSPVCDMWRRARMGAPSARFSASCLPRGFAGQWPPQGQCRARLRHGDCRPFPSHPIRLIGRRFLMNQIDLNGKVAVITGGAQGIGFAIARRLVASGARVSLWDMNAELLTSATAELGANTSSVTVNVADYDSVAAATAQVEQDARQSRYPGPLGRYRRQECAAR
jgi:3-oxoacyl-ACP reductase-like protein